MTLVDQHEPVWDRRKGETAMWFRRFDELFRPMGPERTLLGAYNAWRTEAQKGTSKSVSSAWYVTCKAWKWQDRAEAWDAAEREHRLVEESAERKKRREERRAILQGVKARVAEGIKALNANDLTPHDLVKLVQLVCNEERIEWDDLPTQNIKHSGEGKDGEVLVRILGNIDPEKM